MTWQLTAYVVPTLFATVVALLLSVYTLAMVRNRDAGPTILVFLAITVAVGVWTGFSALKLLHTDPVVKLLFYRVLHVGAAALPPLFFLFTLAYTDRHHWLRPDVIGPVFLLPLVFVGLLLANPGDVVIGGTRVTESGFVILRVDDGPGFFLFIAYSALLTVCALVLIGYEAVRVGVSYYPQAAWIGLGATVPVVFGVLSAADVPPFSSGVNLVPTSGAVSAVAFGFVVFRYRLFDLPPLAYTTATKYSPDGLLVLDPAERIVHANPSGHALLDTVRGGIGDPITSLVEAFDPTAASGDVFEVEPEHGSSRYLRALVKPLVRGEKRVGFVVVLRDVTEQHRRQETLQRQAEQLDAFASTVSHDLRNPLTVAQGFLEVAREESEREAFEKVETAHDRMEEIIRNLLTLSRRGERIDDPVPLSLAWLVEQTWENVETGAATLTIDGERTLEADETMLRHVFENLFRNATEHGGPGVQIRVGTLEGGFFVEDTGRGIPEAHRQTVLESGFTTTEHGTGYGLHIARSVVEAHGWALAVTEGAEGGARFEITGLK